MCRHLVRRLLYEHVELFKRAFVEQQIDTLPCGELAATVLRDNG